MTASPNLLKTGTSSNIADSVKSKELKSEIECKPGSSKIEIIIPSGLKPSAVAKKIKLKCFPTCLSSSEHYLKKPSKSILKPIPRTSSDGPAAIAKKDVKKAQTVNPASANAHSSFREPLHLGINLLNRFKSRTFTLPPRRKNDQSINTYWRIAVYQSR